jgi:hypothetical protein
MIPSVDNDLLFVSAISVWNRALDAHRGSFPYRRILSRLHGLPRGHYAGIEVYDDDPEDPVAWFTVRFHKGMIEPVAAELARGDPCWRVSADYLERVVANAEAFVRDPEQWDWDWLEQWAGMLC